MVTAAARVKKKMSWRRSSLGVSSVICMFVFNVCVPCFRLCLLNFGQLESIIPQELACTYLMEMTLGISFIGRGVMDRMYDNTDALCWQVRLFRLDSESTVTP